MQDVRSLAVCNPTKRGGDVFVARSSIGFLPMPLRFLTLPSRGACRVVETYMYLRNRLSATFNVSLR